MRPWVVTSRLSFPLGAIRIAGVFVLAISVCGCAASPSSPPSPLPAATPVPASINAPPGWRPGDRWVYGWSSGSESGTKTVEVLQLQEINKVSFYVVRIGDLDHFYTRELQWAGSTREQKVESRMSPPEPWFAWPLEVGRRWTHRATYEDPHGKSELNDTFSVVATEVVEVPAGRFSSLKVVRETERRDFDEYWYAPEVRFYAKWIGRRGDAQFEERLREYHPAARLIPGASAPAPPSTTK